MVQGKRVLGTRLLSPDTRELGGLLDSLWHAGLSSVWAMPATILSRTVTCTDFKQLRERWSVLVHADPADSTRPSSVLLWPKGSGQGVDRRLTLSLPAHTGWDWRLPDARSLLATVTYLDQVLGRLVTDAADGVAHQLLADSTLDQSIASLRSSPVDLRTLTTHEGKPIPFTECVRRVAWKRVLTAVEQRQRYVHKYLHCSHLLEGSLSVQLGTGAPEYSSHGRAFDGIRPGIWRVNAEASGSVFDGKRLPGDLGTEWMSTPQVNGCRSIGYQVQIGEGVFWTQSQAVLKRWATTLWQAAASLQTHPDRYRHPVGRANALHAIQLLARRGISILAQEQKAGGWERPDWAVQVLGSGQVNLFSHLVGLVRKGIMPVLIDGDALWVVSDDPNPLTTVLGLLTTSRHWRGYTIGYEVPLPLSREVREAFRTRESVTQLAMELDSLAGEAYS